MRLKLYILFLLFWTILGQSQVTIIPFLNKDKVNVNETFTVTFVVQIKGEIVSESPLHLPDFSKFQIVGSASNRNTIVVGTEVIDEKVYQWVLKPLKPGKVKVGVARMEVNGKSYYTTPIDVEVNEIAQTKAVIPSLPKTYIDVELMNDNVYQNQPIVGKVKAYASNVYDLKKVKNIHFTEQKNLQIEQINYQKSDVEIFTPHLVSQIIARFVLLPTKSGKVFLPPISANIARGKKIKSAPIPLEIKPLPYPQPKEFQNAVGEDYKMEIISPTLNEIMVNEPIKIAVKLKGKGNLSNLIMPLLQKEESLEIYPPKIKRNSQETNKELIAEYIVIPKKSGNLKLTTTGFSYFNPSTKQYIDLSPKSLLLKIKSREHILDEKSTFEKMNEYTHNVLGKVENPILETQGLSSKTQKKMKWKTIILNFVLVILFLFFFLLFRKWQKNRLKNKNYLTSKSLGSVEESEKEIKELLENNIQDDLFFLQKMKEQKKYNAFFEAIKDLEFKLKDKFQVSDIQEFIRNNMKEETMLKYQKIQEKIQFQKYLPVQDEQEIDKIYEAIVKLYSQIGK